MCKEETLNIYFVRHGETEWNKEKRIQGLLDSALTTKGVKDTNKLKEILAEINFTAVFTSELGRAYETAKILNVNNIELQKKKEFNEKNFGLWQGMKKVDIFLKYPKQAHSYFHNIKEYNSADIKAESLEDALKRFRQGINEILDIYEKGNILLVTHGTILKLFFNYIDNKSLDELNENDLMSNTSYRVVKYHKKKLFKKVKECLKDIEGLE